MSGLFSSAFGATALPLSGTLGVTSSAAWNRTGVDDVEYSTTRWRAQRETASGVKDIQVVFSGPEDLEKAELTVEGPSDVPQGQTPLPADYKPTYREPFDPAKKTSDGDYQLVWNGPWSIKDAAGKDVPLPRGNYKLTVKGTKKESTEEIKSNPYDKVSLIEVQDIKLEQKGGVQLQGNPGPGGGLRIFPESSLPGGTNITDKLIVTATILPAVTDAPAGDPVKVFFRSLDVDDPSASKTPVDDETKSKDNCLEARVGPPQNCPVVTDGFLYDPAKDPNAGNPVDGGGGIAITAASDKAVAGLRVATLQGANYRVAASTSQGWLADLQSTQPTGVGELQHPTESLVDPTTGRFQHPQISEMLTVWRTLHLEVDRMDPASVGVTQDVLQYNGSWTRIGRTWRSFPPFAPGRVLEDAAAGFIAQPVPGSTVDHSHPGDWKGATVDPNRFGGRTCADVEVPPCYRVARNSNTKLTVGGGNLNDEADPNDRRYYLRDDEISSLTSATAQTGLMEDVLKELYIELKIDAPNAQPIERWLQNVTTNDLTAMTFRRNAPSSPEYWSTTLLLAFEGALNRDFDPTFEPRYPGAPQSGPVAGETSPNSDQPVAAVYHESIRDFVKTATGKLRPTVTLEEYYRSNTAHELLHALGLDHNGDHTGGLMCAALKNDINEAHRGEITALQKLTLRRMIRPRSPTGLDEDTCPRD